ncbi:class I adenylate-forming enzyme family protein [Streptomyces sp. NPDC048442]|uniref:class I adenylate-forming enzyme family protein n=1 Tax=Streptomyces sp. NPDC048442 TaxID=3154823 RepID=UPI00344A9281
MTDSDQLVVPDLLRIRSSNAPDQSALIIDGVQSLNYGDWERRSNAVAHHLADRGAGRGTRIALLFTGMDWIPYAISYLGVLKTGATAVHLTDRLGAAEQTRRLEQTEAAGILHSADAELPTGFTGWTSTGAALETGDESPLDVSIAIEDLADILYTSGTTGPAKAFGNPHGVLTFGRGPEGLRNFDERSPLMAPMPLGTTSSATTCAVVALTAPGPTVVVDPEDVERMAALVAQLGAGSLMLQPWTAIQLVTSRAHERHDLSSVTRVGSASAPLPPRIAGELLAMMPGAQLNSAYAQGEAVPAVILGTVDPKRPMVMGRPAPGTEVRIAGADDEPLAAGELGEIWLRCPAPKRRYLDESLSRNKWQDGWVRTGDLGRLTEDGEVRLFDRREDVIHTDAGQVSSIEIEEAVYDHPAVLEAAVIGLPEAEGGYHAVTAVVVLNGPQEPELKSFLADRLAPHQRPTVCHFVDSLPRGVTGKVLKPLLRRRFATTTA